MLIALATKRPWVLSQLDINNAFLHGFLDEDVYMVPPERYSKASPGQVCHLNRSLYGLKQASRQWNVEFCSKLVEFGFVQSPNDHCLFCKKSADSFLALVVYVDDVLVTGSNLADIDALKSNLHKLFTIKDLGHAKYFLGLEIARSSSGTYLNQRKYILDILKDVGLLGCKPVSTPFPHGLKLKGVFGVPCRSGHLRKTHGCLLYLNLSRPDLTYCIQQLSQFINNPHSTYWDVAVHVLRYLKGCPSKGLFYSSAGSTNFQAYCDADWATCPDTRKSLTGFCVFFGDALVLWKTKKQVTVSKLAEAEYRAMSQTVCELLWLSYIAADLQVQDTLPIPLWRDNQAALYIVANPVFHERTNHLEINCHIVRNQFKAGFVFPQKISSKLQLADVLTKSLGLGDFQFLLAKLGMLDLHSIPT
ncbi:hypothetical protein DH2020_046828 [Rehmannia glutinosa]|uniref:Reverse transcriptase Ty1/copia-type domain-containing protein n=1 Tax=Rehmannia glutinosa TaxID=99300 RepID=A0ABR0UA34_REHGL